MIEPMTTGAAIPPPIMEALSAPEVIAWIGAFLIAFLGAMTALFRWLKRKIDRLGVETAKTRTITDGIHEQVANTHTVNLREDIDSFRDEMRDGFKRMDHSFGEVHDRQLQEQRDRSALDARMVELERRATAEHERIWGALGDQHD